MMEGAPTGAVTPLSHAAFARHGGALDAARLAYPWAPEPWIDLSTGINPVSYPVGDVTGSAWTRLPDAAVMAGLERTAAARYRAPRDVGVVAAPGTQALIQRLPDLRPGDDVRVLGPTYGEYEAVFRAAGARVRTVLHPDALPGADVAVVVNPNNPDGRLLAPDALVALAGRVGLLVVDEAFVDVLPAGSSLVPRLAGVRAIVLRSFGKTYGLAGLRLGFAVAAPVLVERLRGWLGPWAVSGPAIALGTRALADTPWLEAARDRLEGDAARLRSLLTAAGGHPLGGTPLFQLIDHPAAGALFGALAERGILVRPFAGAPTFPPSWLRFGLPASAASWGRLQAALRTFR